MTDKSFLTERGVTAVGGMLINHSYPYDKKMMAKAVAYGMVMLIRYRGAEDDLRYGRERVIWPMVLGTSSEKKPLLRGYQVMGWSVSAGRRVSKEWRMFRTDRILSMTFTGNFFQTAPSGYDSDDDSVKNIEVRAEMDQVVARQRRLMKKAQIYDLADRTIKDRQEAEDQEDQETTDTADDRRKADRTLDRTARVKATDLSQVLDLKDPFAQDVFSQQDAFVAVFLKPDQRDKQTVVLIGATGEEGVQVDLTLNNFHAGRFTIIKAIDHLTLRNNSEVFGESEFPMYLFQERVD